MSFINFEIVFVIFFSILLLPHSLFSPFQGIQLLTCQTPSLLSMYVTSFFFIFIFYLEIFIHSPLNFKELQITQTWQFKRIIKFIYFIFQQKVSFDFFKVSISLSRFTKFMLFSCTYTSDLFYCLQKYLQYMDLLWNILYSRFFLLLLFLASFYVCVLLN